MSNEHNPIALLINKLQDKWNTEVAPNEHIKLARWIIKPNQHKLYEGFLKLESTQHGSIPDMLLVLLPAFTSEEEHSKVLIKEWIAAYQKEQELIKQYSQQASTTFNWNVDAFEKKISDNSNANTLLLLEMLQNFQKALQNNQPFTLALFPYSVDDTKAYSKWLHSVLKHDIPEHVKIMIFDHEEERYFDTICDKYEDHSISLSVPLDLQGAINKLASQGNPNDPEVQFRQCIIKMSKAVENNNRKEVDKWGEKGLEITQKTGSKSMFSTAHIIYASMLFNFKDFEKVDSLLHKGLALAKQGLQAEDDTCKALIIQYYGFQASSQQLQKKYEEATNLFCKQADTASEIGYPQQSLNAWWMAYNAIKKRDKDRYKSIVKKAYTNGITLDKDTLKSTSMSFIAADYYNILEKERQDEDCQNVHSFMEELEGKQWREQVEEQRKAMEKKRFSISNWF